ncbi:MAG: acylphosphatase [Anaerolineae bacterium]|nr:acylphosphatase [Anaerolineae bacterium]
MGEEQKLARLSAIVEGTVQGVSFRYYTLQRARLLGLTGWVANRRDGSVETVAEGPRDVLEAFLDFLRQGPPAAVVRRVVPQWGQGTDEFDSFRIVYL